MGNKRCLIDVLGSEMRFNVGSATGRSGAESTASGPEDRGSVAGYCSSDQWAKSLTRSRLIC